MSFTKELAQAYRAQLVAQGLAPSTINLRLSATERYLGTEQALAHAVNDALGLDMQ